MKKSRQHSQKRILSTQNSKRQRSLSVNLDKIRQSTFIKKFEGKINIVTRESGLRGVLMKTIKPLKNRYEENQVNAVSRVVTQILPSSNASKTLTPHLGYNISTDGKQNENKINIKKKSKLGTAQTIQQSEYDKQITPFHLPQINRIKHKKQVKRWLNVPKNLKSIERKELKSNKSVETSKEPKVNKQVKREFRKLR